MTCEVPPAGARSVELALALFSVAFVAGLAVAGEGVARLIPRGPAADSPAATIERYSDHYGWDLRPRARRVSGGRRTTINTLGYRGRELPRRRDTAATRLVLLGDSIAFGHEVDDRETFAHLLDQDPDLEVVNLAVQGYGPDQSLLKLEREGLAFEPDIVVFSLCLENDLADAMLAVSLYDGAHPKPFFRLEAGRLVLHDGHVRRPAWRRMAADLRERSRLLALLSSSAADPPSSGAAAHWLDRREAALRDTGAAADLASALVARMRDRTLAAGAEFMVLVHPGEASSRRASHLSAQLLAGRVPPGTRLVDMRERHRARGVPFRRLALDAVGHLNASGHREAAGIVRDLLRQTGLDRPRAAERAAARTTGL